MTPSPSNVHLCLIGRLTPDDRLVLRPGYLAPRSEARVGPSDSPLVAELYGEEGTLLQTHPLIAAPYCGDGSRLPDLAVRGTIPFPTETRLVRFLHDGVIVHEIVVPQSRPQVDLEWQPEPTVTGRQRISWSARHPEGHALEFFLRYTYDGGDSWRRVGSRTRTEALELDFDAMPGGPDCRVQVVATDGVNTQMAESSSFSVAVKSCRAMIFEPMPGAVYVENDTVSFRGQGFYLEQREPETAALRWTSSEDGVLGEGVALDLTTLSPGRHRIELLAGRARPGSAETIVTIEKPSRAEHRPAL